MKNQKIKKLVSYADLLRYLSKLIQRANYDKFILRLATAYVGYSLYLPAFADFRGRIYRCGVLHFHESDLARSLVVFDRESELDRSYNRKILPINKLFDVITTQAAFYYKSFSSPMLGFLWALTKVQQISGKAQAEDWTLNQDEMSPFLNLTPTFLNKIVSDAKEAKRPFQYVSYLLYAVHYEVTQKSPRGMSLFEELPITQDASSSAYQIISYFLMDESLAIRTNLMPSLDGEIQDLYSYFLEEFKGYLQKEGESGALEMNLVKSVTALLNRQIIKSFVMPVVYGKRLQSYADDLFDAYSHYLTRADCVNIAKACYRFWEIKYSGMKSLIDLVRCIGQIVSSAGNPVVYGVPYYNTVQDYIKMKTIKLSVYDKDRKQHRISLRIPSSQRDPAKSQIASFANFIHQKDASIAMNVVEKLMLIGGPIYTVHDNFRTTPQFCEDVPLAYSEAFLEMGPPLQIINMYIYMNVIEPIARSEPTSPSEEDYTNELISSETLRKYLLEFIPLNKCTSTKSRLETIETIISSYERYANAVCGGNYDDLKLAWTYHVEKYNTFMDKVMNGGGTRHCAHY